MTPTEEIEKTINEMINKNDASCSDLIYNLVSLPEVFINKNEIFYIIRMKNGTFDKILYTDLFEKTRSELEYVVFEIRNKVIDRPRDIIFMGNHIASTYKIHYYDCLFTNTKTTLGNMCINCVVEG